MFNKSFLLGLGLAIAGIVNFIHHASLLRSSVTTKGEVFEYSTFLSKHPGPQPAGGTEMYTPRIRFKTAEGNEVTFDYRSSSNHPGYDVGDAVEVVYDPAHPDEASVLSIWDFWLEPLVLLVAGVVTMAARVGMFIWRRSH
jgi:hypothetical protein